MSFYLKTLTRFYFFDEKNEYVCSIKNRLVHASSSRISQKKMTLREILRDRMRLIFNIGKNLWFHKIKDENDSGLIFSSTVLSEKAKREIKYRLKGEASKKNPYALLPQKCSNRASVPLIVYKEYLKDVALSFLSLFDLNQYELYPLFEFFRYKNCLINTDVRELHIFSTYSPSHYLLSLLDLDSADKYVYAGNAPLNSKWNHGVFKNINYVTSNPIQVKEIRKLNVSKSLVFYDVKILQGVNLNQLYLKDASKNINYKIGFFSEGWWLRRPGDGFTIEDPLLLKKYLDLPRNDRANTEIKLFERLLRLARDHNIPLAVYPHPSEERAVSKGFTSPYEDWIDDEVCFYGAKMHGISNFFEVAVAVTMLPDSSIITDRSSVGLKTIYCSELMLNKQVTEPSFTCFRKIVKSECEYELDKFEDLDKFLCS